MTESQRVFFCVIGRAPPGAGIFLEILCGFPRGWLIFELSSSCFLDKNDGRASKIVGVDL